MNASRGRLSAIACVAAALLLWELFSRVELISPLFFPAPSRSLVRLAELVHRGGLASAIAVSLYRLLLSVAIGGAAGALLAYAMGSLRGLGAALDPIIAGLHPLPKLALFPLFLVVLGIGNSSRVALVTVAAFFPMVVSVFAGVRLIEGRYLEVAASYGASYWLRLRRVVLPGSVPSVFTGLRIALSTGMGVLVAVEMLSADDGLGAQIWLSWQTMRIEELYATLFTIALLGLLLNGGLNLLSRKLAPWSEDHSPSPGRER